jgi:hypothetical protein
MGSEPEPQQLKNPPADFLLSLAKSLRVRDHQLVSASEVSLASPTPTDWPSFSRGFIWGPSDAAWTRRAFSRYPRVNLCCHLYARARGARPARAASAAAATRSATGSASPPPDRTSWPRGASGMLSLRPFGLVRLIPWAASVPKNLARRKTRRWLTNRPCSSYQESDSKERLRVSNWIVQGLYNDAVKKTVEL